MVELAAEALMVWDSMNQPAGRPAQCLRHAARTRHSGPRAAEPNRLGHRRDEPPFGDPHRFWRVRLHDSDYFYPEGRGVERITVSPDPGVERIGESIGERPRRLLERPQRLAKRAVYKRL